MDVQSDSQTYNTRLLPDSASFPGDTLHIANNSVAALVQQFGTPLYIFDHTTIVNACVTYLHAFQNF